MQEIDLTVRFSIFKKKFWYTLQFDRNYGAYKRTGWSIAIDGRYSAQLEKHLWKALWMAYQHQQDIRDWKRSSEWK